MSRFLQLHLLTFYPPSNLNRDDTGRPKTATMGGAQRLRISSQALKRAWRTSDGFAAALAGHRGQRTQRMGREMVGHLITKGVAEDKAIAVTREIMPLFGKVNDAKDDHPVDTAQLAFISTEERTAAFALAERLAAGEKLDPKKEPVLQNTDTAADIAMFGRMLADAPDFNREAAVQVAHAVTTHRATVEDDFYTAVDDLKTPAEDAGAGFVGELGFGSGVFYLYLCVDLALLKDNLGGNTDLAATALTALAEAAATVSPSGKQNSFAARARAQYMLAERGDAQPRTLASAFARPVEGADLVAASVAALAGHRKALADAYGPGSDSEAAFTVGGDGSLADVVAFVRAAYA